MHYTTEQAKTHTLTVWLMKARCQISLFLLLIPQMMISLKMSKLEGWTMAMSLWHLLVTTASLAALILLVTAVLAKLPRRIALACNILFIFSYGVLQGYHWVRHEPLSFLIIYKNGRDLLSQEGLNFALSNITPLAWLAIALTLSALIALQFRYKIFSVFPQYSKPMPLIALLLCVNFGIAITAPNQGNEYFEFLSSTYRYFKPAMTSRGDADLYPYLHLVAPGQDTNISDKPERPHVFIVMLESFSAFYMDRIENGKRVTPFLDALKERGVFVDNFYSASVETSKGQFATLCSVYPSYRTNVFSSYADNKFRCLSHILKENGYTNVFMKAYHNLKFENTEYFVMANGFDYAHGMSKQFVSDEEMLKNKIGWGIRDDLFYQKTFNYLDELQQAGDPLQRFFVTTMSVTNHMMFDSIPKAQRYIYPDAKSHHENYTNSMHLTDKYLEEFFVQLNKRDYLKNSIVVVLGDNGFPMGQHRKNYHNTKTAYNEMFKMPLLVLWNDALLPQKLTDNAYSQLDVAPTLLDLLKIKTTNHFLGQSIFKAHDENYFVPMVQPFDGTYLATIRYPYKLIKNLKSGKEELYNIKLDPGEKNNLAESDSVDYDTLLVPLRKDLIKLQENETILAENRVYPTNINDNFRVKVQQNRIPEGESLAVQLLGIAPQAYQITFTVQSFNRHLKTYSTQEVTLNPNKNLSIPPNFLQPGINKVTLKAYVDGVPHSTSVEDVYVVSEDVDLLTELDPKGSQGWGQLNIDRSVRGGPLTIDGERFGFGLGAHAPSEHTISLNNRYASLLIGFGLDDEASCGDGARFEIWADAAKLYSSDHLDHGQHHETLVDVAGYETLRLVTIAGQGKACDHVDWTNPILFKSPRTAPEFELVINNAATGVLPEQQNLGIQLHTQKPSEFAIQVINRLNQRQLFENLAQQEFIIPYTLFDAGTNPLNINVLHNNAIVKRLSQTVFYQTGETVKLETLPYKAKQGWGDLHVGLNCKNKPLTVAGTVYPSGFGTHSDSRIDIQLDGKFKHFFTSAGLDDNSTCGDGATFNIEADGKTLYSGKKITNGVSTHITLDVNAVKTLSLIVDKGKHNRCDHANWLTPMVVAK